MIIAPPRPPGAHPNLRHGRGTAGIYLIPAEWVVPPGAEADQLEAAQRDHYWSCRWCTRAPKRPQHWRAYVHGCGWAEYLAAAYVRTAARGELTTDGRWSL